MGAFTLFDLIVLLVYIVGITAWGAWLGRHQRGGSDYFLGSRDLPWGAVLLSVVATETSTLTFLSIPGVAYLGNLTFLQLTLGYLLGRVAISALFLPAYYRGEMKTAYTLLETRFGTGTRRFASAIFMVTRLLADSVRLFATAIPLAIMTGWGYPVSIGVIAVATLVYTFFGGIRAVVWTDAVQMGLYLLSAVIAAGFLHALIPGGWGAAFESASAAGKLQILDFTLDPSVAYAFWAGVIGGGCLSMASHGTDQLIVQRLLTCRDLKSAQKALVGSGLVVIVQFALFLLVGIGLWSYYGGQTFPVSDEIFATFIIEVLPPGLTGLLVAGIFAAAMSSLSSSINSLASVSAYDFWGPMVGAENDDFRLLRAGRVFTLIWAMLLVGVAVAYIPLARDAAAVVVALTIASLVYGGFLGVFLLGTLDPKANQKGAILGMVVAIAVVTSIWKFGGGAVAFPWFVPIGALIAIGVGSGVSRLTATGDRGAA